MLDDLNDTVLVTVNVIITFEDTPEVWAALALYPKEVEYDVGDDDDDDEKVTPMIGFDFEMEVGKRDTAEQRVAAAWPTVQAVRDAIPIAPEMTKKIKYIFFG